MKKIFTFLFVIMCSVSVKGQALGDYMEIDGVPGFVFYVDESGEHGLMMSMFPITANWEKIQTKNLIKEGILTEEHIKKLSFPKNKIKTPKKKLKEYYSDLSKILGDEGEENRRIIEEYCNNNNLPLDVFEGQSFAASLGEGWFIPGNKEIEIFASFFAGGLGEGHLIDNNMRSNELTNTPIAKFTLDWIVRSQGLLSSSIKSDIGFQCLVINHKSKIKAKYFLEIYDITTKGVPILKACPYIRTCAVHKF